MCLPDNTDIHLEGKPTSHLYKSLEIKFKSCTGVDCETAANINALLLDEDYLVTVYFLDTLINPDDHQPLSYFITDDFSTTFNLQDGIDSIVMLQNYSVSTDNSIMPLEDIQTVSGPTINEAPIIKSTYIQTPATETLALITIRRSSAGIKVTRHFFKFDELLSYVGGLFGLIALIIDLPLKAYNRHCMEIGLGDEIFNYRNKPEK